MGCAGCNAVGEGTEVAAVLYKIHQQFRPYGSFKEDDDVGEGDVHADEMALEAVDLLIGWTILWTYMDRREVEQEGGKGGGSKEVGGVDHVVKVPVDGDGDKGVEIFVGRWNWC